MSPILGARGGLSASAYGFTSAVAAVGDYESIATVTVGSGGAADVTFSSIPNTYKHLQIRGIARGSRTTYGNDNMSLQVNGDTGSNYTWHRLNGTGSAATSTGSSSATTQVTFNALAALGAPTNTFSAHIIDILDYSSANKNKTIRNLDGVDINGTVAGEGGVIEFSSGSWMNSSTAISSIKLYAGSPNFVQYTTFALYGIK
jgi:hypothetical protein